ncbi:cyclin-like protein [Chytridium lagenaria]|nr:cyclin-like protein [Chytridium lagenaria]
MVHSDQQHQPVHTKLASLKAPPQGPGMNVQRPGFHQPAMPPTAYDPRRAAQTYAMNQNFTTSTLPSIFAQPPKPTATSLRYSSLQTHQSDYALLEAFEDVVDSSEPEEYGHEIMEAMSTMESKTWPNPSYMESQNEITWKLRKTLIFWLIEIHSEYDLRPETLFLTINFIDRVCSKRIIPKTQYQLLGITALWVAAKYEENHGKVPTLKNLIYICCNTFLEREYLAMEQSMLNDLDFVLGHPTAESFLKANFKFYKDVSPETRAIARYIMEITLVHRRFMNYRPSVIAASCFMVSEAILGRRFTPPVEMFARCIVDIFDSLRHPPKQMFAKYSVAKFLKASIIIKKWSELNQHITTGHEFSAALFGHHAYAAPHLHYDVPSGLLTPPKEVPNVRWLSGMDMEKDQVASRTWSSELAYAVSS